MRTLNTLLGFLILITLLSGCSARHVNEPLQSPTPVVDKQESADVALVNPLTDDPDNPSPHNPLIKEFGNVPEVRTYLRLKQKLGRGIGLNIDEAIELYTAEVHLYPTPAAKEMLKDLKTDKKRYDRLGIQCVGIYPPTSSMPWLMPIVSSFKTHRSVINRSLQILSLLTLSRMIQTIRVRTIPSSRSSEIFQKSAPISDSSINSYTALDSTLMRQ